MQTSRPTNKKKGMNDKNRLNRNIFLWAGLLLLFLYMFRIASFAPQATPKELSYGEFFRLLETNRETGAIDSVVKVDDRIKGVF